jgi:hypothetical protein
MPLTDVIDSLSTDDNDPVVILRANGKGTMVNGIFTPPSRTAFPTVAIVQPATGEQRVIGGMDMHSLPSGNAVDDVRVVYTRDQVFPETATLAADHLTLEGAEWIVFRCQPWDLTGDRWYRVTASRFTNGAA